MNNTDMLQSLCQIIDSELEIGSQRYFIENQDFDLPKDDKLFVTIREASSRIIGNNVEYNYDIETEIKSVFMQSTIEINLFSITNEANDRYQLVLMSLNSAFTKNEMVKLGLRIDFDNQVNDLGFIDGVGNMKRKNIRLFVYWTQTKETPIDFYDQYKIIYKKES